MVQVVETTGDRAMLLQPQPTVTFGSGSPSGLVITVNSGTKYQQMDGFGASLTDSSAWVVSNKLTASQQTTLWQSLFSPTSGIGISFLRQPMGASDFTATGNYSYDDLHPPPAAAGARRESCYQSGGCALESASLDENFRHHERR
jgi:glucosylceramidase